MATFTCPKCGEAVELSTGPRPGGVTYAVWEYCKAHPTATRTEVLTWGQAQGYNPLTVLTQFGAYKRSTRK